MKKIIASLLIICISIAFTACSQSTTDKAEIISIFQQNEDTFIQATKDGDFSEVESISGVQEVYKNEEYIDIQFGGYGFGSSTGYYGIFYSANNNMCAVDVAGPENELSEHGNGYKYQENDGDNKYYVEPLGNHFFYYEASF